MIRCRQSGQRRPTLLLLLLLLLLLWRPRLLLPVVVVAVNVRLSHNERVPQEEQGLGRLGDGVAHGRSRRVGWGGRRWRRGSLTGQKSSSWSSSSFFFCFPSTLKCCSRSEKHNQASCLLATHEQLKPLTRIMSVHVSFLWDNNLFFLLTNAARFNAVRHRLELRACDVAACGSFFLCACAHLNLWNGQSAISSSE